MAFSQHESFLKEHPVIRNTSESQNIKDIGGRIAKLHSFILNTKAHQII